jgi:carbon storage regulator
MLVLSRKAGERIYIGQDVVVTVTEIDRGKVRLGIDAPNSVPILREEILFPQASPEERQVPVAH